MLETWVASALLTSGKSVTSSSRGCTCSGLLPSFSAVTPGSVSDPPRCGWSGVQLQWSLIISRCCCCCSAGFRPSLSASSALVGTSTCHTADTQLLFTNWQDGGEAIAPHTFCAFGKLSKNLRLETLLLKGAKFGLKKIFFWEYLKKNKILSTHLLCRKFEAVRQKCKFFVPPVFQPTTQLFILKVYRFA